jgi:hypothetical protein
MGTIEIISVIGIAVIAFIQSYRVIKIKMQLKNVERTLLEAFVEICRLKDEAKAPKKIKLHIDEFNKSIRAIAYKEGFENRKSNFVM